MLLSNDTCNYFLARYERNDYTTGSNLFFIVTIGLCLLPTTFLNVLTLITIRRRPNFHSPSSIFICNLAIADIAVGVGATPLMLCWKFTKHFDITSWEICTLGFTASFVGTTAAGSSFLTLTAATVDRFLALRYHLHYPTRVTTRRVIIVCVINWVLALGTALCLGYSILLYEFVVVVLMVPCMSLMPICYYKIHSIVRYHQSQIQAQIPCDVNQTSVPNISLIKKSVSVLVYLVIVFFVLYTPYTVVIIYQKFQGYTVFYYRGITISLAILYINSTLNPIIYCWRLKELRRAMKQTFIDLFSK